MKVRGRRKRTDECGQRDDDQDKVREKVNEREQRGREEMMTYKKIKGKESWKASKGRRAEAKRLKGGEEEQRRARGGQLTSLCCCCCCYC